MKFSKLNPRYNSAPIDDDRNRGLIALNTVGGAALPISGINFSGVGALVTAIVDGSGNQITTFGGGTQYTDAGTPPAHPVGNALVFDNGSSAWQAVNSTHGLPVNILNSSIAVTGTFWQATQPVSLASLPALASGTNVIGHVIIDSGTITTVTAVTAITNALPAGTNVIGHVITDSGSVTNATLSAETTKVIGTVNQGTSPWIIAGDTASGSTDANNPVKVGGKYNSTKPTFTDGQRGDLQIGTRGSLATSLFAQDASTGIAARADNADGVAASATANNLGVINRNTIANGSNWDRQVTVVNATNSTGTGITAVGILAQFDDVSPTTITENQFGNVRMSNNRNLYGTIRDAAGNERGANVTAANELNVLPTKKDVFTTSAFTITLASLANSTVGVGRQSTLITSNTAQSAIISVKFTVGTSPNSNSLIYVYLIRGDGTLTDDNAGATDAGLTVINAPLLGTILCSATSSNTAYYGVFDTKFLGSLGPTFGIAIVNSTGVTANATGGNFSANYTLIT